MESVPHPRPLIQGLPYPRPERALSKKPFGISEKRGGGDFWPPPVLI